MDKIFKSFLFFIFIFSNIIAQTNDCNDVTKEVRKVLTSGGVELYNAKLIGGCIDNKNTIHISLTLNSKYSFVLMGSGLSKEQTAMTQTLEPFFTSVEKIYKKYTKVNNYILYFIYYEDIIDNYGNTTGKEKRIMTSMSMSRETANKVNWKYVKDNLRTSIWLNREDDIFKFIKMLDTYSGKTINKSYGN